MYQFWSTMSVYHLLFCRLCHRLWKDRWLQRFQLRNCDPDSVRLCRTDHKLRVSVHLSKQHTLLPTVRSVPGRVYRTCSSEDASLAQDYDTCWGIKIHYIIIFSKQLNHFQHWERFLLAEFSTRFWFLWLLDRMRKKY